MTLDNDLKSTVMLLNQGRLKPALKGAKAGMKRHKSHPAFPNIAGICLSGLGKHKDAVPYFKKALSLDTGFHDARKNMAQTLVFLGRAEAAMPMLDKVLQARPKDTGALYIKAQGLMALGDNTGAMECVTAALRLDKRNARALRLRGVLRKAIGDYEGAVADFEALLAMNANDVETLIDISLPLARLIRSDDATAAARKAVALAPDNIEARHRLATQLLANGDTEGARAECEAVLAMAPNDPVALETLARMNSAAENAELGPRIDQAIQTLSRDASDRPYLHFARARVAQQAGDMPGFAEHLGKANAAMAAKTPYDATETARSMASVQQRFPDEGSTVSPLESATPHPVYVVGMPRSGTTLTEVLLSAHPDVVSLGERAVPALLLDRYLTDEAPFDADAARAYAEADSARLPDFARKAQVYVDKMPENYRLLGFLAKAHPEARMVQLRRDPRDVALSIWQAHFGGASMTYAYDLAAMADRFNFHARVMAHWHQVMPGRILELRYEDLVADIEGQTRGLAEFCGLDWVEDMAHPERHEGQVLTFSDTQLRQSVHSRSVGKWRKHADMLAPFIDGLDPGLWPEIQG